MVNVDGIYLDEMQHSFGGELLTSGNPKTAMLYVLGVCTGLRISDLLRLRVEDVGANFAVYEAKTGKLKKGSLTPLALETLETYVKCYNLKPSDRLFSVSRQTVYRHFKRAASVLGLENIGVHSMRKIYA
jgi:integrase